MERTMTSCTERNTALLLIGFQHDYFDPSGILHGVVEESHRVSGTLENTLKLIEFFKDSDMTMVSTPIVFSELYDELENPIGILKTIRDVQAFKAGTPGAETIPEIKAYGDRIIELPGKKSFNAFSNTSLHATLRDRGVTKIVFAGCVTSICVHASALQAFDLGYEVTVMSDCTSARTPIEQEFFCSDVFPLFSHVRTLEKVLTNEGALS
jgi:nicotinamidase-related amidase